MCISAVTRAELRFGVLRLSSATRLATEVEKFLSGVHTLAWDEVVADQFAEARADLQRGGTPIGSMDTMIAAHAKAINAVLVTNNVRRFRHLKLLAIESWPKARHADAGQKSARAAPAGVRTPCGLLPHCSLSWTSQR